MNVLLIDSNVTDYQIIVESCNTNTLPFVYSYNITRDEISKFFSYISQKINRIGIFADQKAKLFLDNEPFFAEDENTLILSDNTSFIIQLIRDYDISYIDYFACNSLNDPKWVNYYEILMSLTNVIVGASNNATGNIQYGGDWIMENTCQDIESIYFSKNIEYYRYLLGNTGFKVGTGLTSRDITDLFNVGTGGDTDKYIINNYNDNPVTNYGSGFRFLSGVLYYDMINDLDVATATPVDIIPAITNATRTNYYVWYSGNYYDIGQFITPIPVYGIFNLGLPSTSTWRINVATSDKLSTSNWIWNANSIGKPTVPPNVNILFSYNYYSNIIAITTGKFYAAVVGVGYLYFNGAAPIYIGTDTITGLTGASLISSSNTITPVTGAMTIVPGINYIQIVCYNSGTSAGLIAAFYNGATLDASSNDAWTSEIVSSANTSNSLATVVKGGLNTTVYNVGTNLFIYNNTTAGSINQSYYYNSLNPSIIKSNNIVTNFQAITDISSTCIINVDTTYGSNYWGFKASGFFVPPSRSTYTFSLSSNDDAELWLSTNARTPSIGPTLKSSGSTTTGTTATLTANTYYPFLIFYGQQTLGQNFSLIIKQGTTTGTILTHSDVFYYVNYNLPVPPNVLPLRTNMPSIEIASDKHQSYSRPNIYGIAYYVFSSGTFRVNTSCICNIIMVGAGGLGGPYAHGTAMGGTGGGVVYGTINLTNGDYTINIGTSSSKNTTFIGTDINITAYGGKNGTSNTSNRTYTETGTSGTSTPSISTLLYSPGGFSRITVKYSSYTYSRGSYTMSSAMNGKNMYDTIKNSEFAPGLSFSQGGRPETVSGSWGNGGSSTTINGNYGGGGGGGTEGQTISSPVSVGGNGFVYMYFDPS